MALPSCPSCLVGTHFFLDQMLCGAVAAYIYLLISWYTIHHKLWVFWGEGNQKIPM